MHTRVASLGDAERMSRVLQDIIHQTGRDRENSIDFVTSHYVANPTTIRCTVAVDDEGRIAGFQSLKIAGSGNRYDVPVGWGIIGTHISPSFHRQGIGRILFSASLEAARHAGIENIDAYISAENTSGLRYYEAIGFQTYREQNGITQKVFQVDDH